MLKFYRKLGEFCALHLHRLIHLRYEKYFNFNICQIEIIFVIRMLPIACMRESKTSLFDFFLWLISAMN